MKKPLALVACAAAAMTVAGCGSVAKVAGITKTTPDEFKVVTKAPLVVPPDYGLRPPRPGDPRPQELRPEDQAQTAMFGKDIGGQASAGERLFVSKAGAESVDPRIRDQVDVEGASLVRKDENYANRLMRFGKKNADGSPLDAVSEKARLDDEEAIRRASGGGTVVIERDPKGGFKLPGL